MSERAKLRLMTLLYAAMFSMVAWKLIFRFHRMDDGGHMMGFLTCLTTLALLRGTWKKLREVH